MIGKTDGVHKGRSHPRAQDSSALHFPAAPAILGLPRSMSRPTSPATPPRDELPLTIHSELPGPDGAPIRTRRPVADDAPTVLAYLRRVGAETPFLSFGAEGPPVTEEEERRFLARIATTDNALAIIAEWHGEMVGYLTFTGGNRRRTHHVGEFGITVVRAVQGVGLGRRLLELLLQWAQAGGIVRKINLVVRADNARAIALYADLGFTIEGTKRRDMLIDGTFHDALLMGIAVDPVETAP